MVSECWNGAELRIEFRRSLGEEELCEWKDLRQELNDHQLGVGRDKTKWKLGKLGVYTTNLCIGFYLLEGSIYSKRLLQKLWKTKCL